MVTYYRYCGDGYNSIWVSIFIYYCQYLNAAILFALGWATYNLLSGQDIGTLINDTEPAGPLMTMPAAITMVAGGFIIAAMTLTLSAVS